MVSGEPRRKWIDDNREWTDVKDCCELKRNAEDRKHWKDLAGLPCT